MRELVQRAKQKLRARHESDDSRPAPAPQDPKNLESVNGIMKSATTLSAFAFTLWAVKKLGKLWNAGKQELEDERRAERNREKARRDLAETKQRQDEQDTQAIRRQISKDWVARERRNLPPAPKSIRGHWEGHVFIPNEKAPKPVQGGGKDKSKPKTAAKRG